MRYLVLPCLHYLSPRYLLLSFYIMHVPGLISITVSLLVPTCLRSRHSFQCMIMIRFYRYTCACLCTPSGFRITTCLGSSIWLPWILMSRSWSLEHVGAWACRIPVADLKSASVAWISSGPSRVLSFQAPCAPLEFSFCKLVSAFCTVHTCISPSILTFMSIDDVISL